MAVFLNKFFCVLLVENASLAQREPYDNYDNLKYVEKSKVPSNFTVKTVKEQPWNLTSAFGCADINTKHVLAAIAFWRRPALDSSVLVPKCFVRSQWYDNYLLFIYILFTSVRSYCTTIFFLLISLPENILFMCTCAACKNN